MSWLNSSRLNKELLLIANPITITIKAVEYHHARRTQFNLHPLGQDRLGFNVRGYSWRTALVPPEKITEDCSN